jgi:hypothetical protein
MNYVNWGITRRLLKNIVLLRATYARGLLMMKKKLFPKDLVIDQLIVVIEELQTENQRLLEENDRLAGEASMAFRLLDDMKEAEDQVGDFMKSLSDALTPTQDELISSMIITDDVGEA